MPPPSDDGGRSNVDLPTNHVIVCELGPLGGAAVRALNGLGACVVGVVADAAEEDEAAPSILTIEGDPTSEIVLKRAYVSRASTLISTVEGDEANALICLVARALNTNIRLVVRGESSHSIRILERVGADAVVCPEVEAGRALARAVLDERDKTEASEKEVKG